MEDLTGKTLGQYHVTGPIGEGGMAAVYQAYQPGVDRYVALKILPRHFASDPQFIIRFDQEARIIAKLQHPHILPVFDYGEADGYTYIVMPFVQSGTLADLLHGDPLPMQQINHIMAQVGDALDYAHSQGVIHRDIKPSNVLMDERGNCLLTDFGIGKILSGSTQLTRTGDVIGTPAYMSPEQGLGGNLDGRSDIYSLGVMLYEMVTGRKPFKAETPMAVIIKHIHDPLPQPRIVNPDIPEPVERIILKTLSKQPEHRYQNPGEMVAALHEVVGTNAIDKVTPPTVTQAESSVTEVVTPGKKVKQSGGTRSPVVPKGKTNWVFLGIGGLGGFIGLVIIGGIIFANRFFNNKSLETTPSLSAITTPVSSQTHTPPVSPHPSATDLVPTILIPTINPDHSAFLYGTEGLVLTGPAVIWTDPPGFVDVHQTDILVGPKGNFERVVRLSVKGYGHGEQTAGFTVGLDVPDDVDIVSIPVATALNGSIDETDSESGLEILVHDPSTGQESWTYGSYLLETELGVPYVFAFADVSPFRGQQVQLTITLRQLDVCAGSQCTQNADFFIGDLYYGVMSDLCTTLSNGTYLLYDYYNDPTPQEVEDCDKPLPYYFIDIEDGPYNYYGIGESEYSIPFALPEKSELVEFRLYYGYHAREMKINNHVFFQREIYAAFPRRSGEYLNIAEPSRYSPFNNNPEAIAPYLDWGKNNLSITIFTENAWEERPFDVFIRVKVPVP